MLNWKQQLRDVESAYEDIFPDIGDNYNRTPHGSPVKSNAKGQYFGLIEEMKFSKLDVNSMQSSNPEQIGNSNQRY